MIVNINQSVENSNQIILEINHLSVSYQTRLGEVEAVRDVSLMVSRGEVHGIVGESGSGKSTLAFAIMGFLGSAGKVKKGSIQFLDFNLNKLTQQQIQKLRGKHIAMVYQDPTAALNPSMRVGEQIAEVFHVHQKMNRNKAWEKTLEIMNSVKLPDVSSIARRYPHQLSGGMQQRIVIAMALGMNPDLLIMDEPTTGLDVTIEATILDLVNELKNKFDSAILYITHNLGVVARVCDKVSVMYAGEIVENGNVEDIFHRPSHPYTIGLMRSVPKPGIRKERHKLISMPGRLLNKNNLDLRCAFANRCLHKQNVCVEEHPDLFEITQNHQSRCFFWDKVKNEKVDDEIVEQRKEIGHTASYLKDPVILSVNELRKYFKSSQTLFASHSTPRRGEVRAVDGISFDVEDGKTFGLVGESGCGKSTTVHCIMGKEIPTGGEILFKSMKLTEMAQKRSRSIHKQLQLVFQNPDLTFNPSKTIGQSIGRVIKLFNTKGDIEINETISELLNLVRLDDTYIDRYPHQLSGGEKQRAAIARVFAGDPILVLCDEIMSALDVSVQASIINLLIDLQAQKNVTYLFISHDLSVVQYLCDHVAVLYLGRICEIGPVNQVFSPPYHPYTEALLSAIPVPDPHSKQSRIRLEGPVPSASNPPSGCVFHTRCPRKLGTICENEFPPKRIIESKHIIYCHIPLEDL